VPPAVGAAAWLPAGELAGERRGSPRLRRISKHHADLEAVFLVTSRTRHVWATSRPLRGAAPPGHPGAAALGQTYDLHAALLRELLDAEVGLDKKLDSPTGHDNDCLTPAGLISDMALSRPAAR
jgi:hypothetical protein